MTSLSNENRGKLRPFRAAAWTALVVLTYLLLTPHPLALFGAGGQATEEAVDGTLSGTLQHMMAYGVLTAFLYGGRVGLWAGVSGSALLACGHGVLCELLQFFVPMRTVDLVDAGANAVGAGIAGVIIFALDGLWGGGHD